MSVSALAITQGMPIRFRIERATNALLDVLTLANDGDLGTIDPERQQRLLIRAIGLGGKRGKIGRLSDTTPQRYQLQ